MIVKCPNELPKRKEDWYVFLAGPIQDAPEWQNNVPEIPGVTFISPRRETIEGFDYMQQINWETIGLRISDVVIFYIPKPEREISMDHDYAQTTRTEFGEVLARGKKVIVGINKEFKGRRYFEEKLKQYDKNSIVYETLEEVLKELKEVIKPVDKDDNIFFISDTHFSSERALKLSKRPFRSIKEMDWSIIEKWNNVVRPDSIIYHLGDFGELWPIQYLNGSINFVYGNYERNSNNITESSFNLVFKEPILTVVKDQKYYLSHEPLSGKIFCENNKDCFSLFGHIHGRQKVKEFGLDVGVDANNYSPISINEVEFFRNAIEKGYYDDEVWS